ncbi:MAG: reverse transcriptase domain-containing protein [Candidatus Sumerlaeaceae bacterium]|nr:reverse transcriptase domain-containing protein [Candidatus Sumerlaeaceae bacterium]
MGSFMPLVAELGPLRRAFARVRANSRAAGVDGVTPEVFARGLEGRLKQLRDDLFGGNYRPQAVLRAFVPKVGRSEMRPIGIPTVRDRVVMGALRGVLEPMFETGFADCSYGYRAGLGAHRALEAVAGHLAAGRHWVLEADFDDFFDTLPHAPLLRLVEATVPDADLCGLVGLFLRQPVFDGQRTRVRRRGVHQGSALSPLLANVYANPLDHLLLQAGHHPVRYADDFVVLGRHRGEVGAALDLVRGWTEKAGLRLHPEKTRLVREDDPAGEGFDFLGYRFECGTRRPSPRGLAALRGAVNDRLRKGGTPAAILADINRLLEAWYQYFRHGSPAVFAEIDAWVRRRLSGVLAAASRRLAPMSLHDRWERDRQTAASAGRGEPGATAYDEFPADDIPEAWDGYQ